MTERLHFHFSLSCIGEGNGNPLQCSSLENPRDRGAWWSTIYGVAQSRTRLKQLSSSSSNSWWLKKWRICLRCRRLGLNPWDGKIPWRRDSQPTPVFLPGEFHGQRSLVATVHGIAESNATEQLMSTLTFQWPIVLFCSLFLVLMSEIRVI